MSVDRGLLLDIVIGTLGTFGSGVFILPLMGLSEIDSGVITIESVLLATLGAMILLTLVKVFKIRMPR